MKVFFYGTFMSPKVLEEYGITAGPFEIVRLDHYALTFNPYANLSPKSSFCVWGVIYELSSFELSRLYSAEFVQNYKPCPISVRLKNGELIAAITYIDPAKDSHFSAPTEYLERLGLIRRMLNIPDETTLQIVQK